MIKYSFQIDNFLSANVLKVAAKHFIEKWQRLCGEIETAIEKDRTQFSISSRVSPLW